MFKVSVRQTNGEETALNAPWRLATLRRWFRRQFA